MSETIFGSEIDVDRLLPLVGVRRTSRRFGVLLRHYWLPATELTYDCVENAPCDRVSNGLLSDTVVSSRRIVRKPVRCDADVCVWRETANDSEERFCIYDRSGQSFRTKAITEIDAFPVDEDEARAAAFLHVPVLTPLLPIPIGFQWHVSAKNGHMNFTLDSEATFREMPIVFVKREGRFVFGGDPIHREGMTAIAPDRCVVLEDRVHDVFPDTGAERFSTVRLIRSRMIPGSE